MGEDEARRQGIGKAKLGDYRLEVVAVGAEAVEEDDRGPRREQGLDEDGFGELGR